MCCWAHFAHSWGRKMSTHPRLWVSAVHLRVRTRLFLARLVSKSLGARFFSSVATCTYVIGESHRAPAESPWPLPAQVVCTLVAAFLHFFFLSSFCWVLTEAWQSYMAVTGRLRSRLVRKRFLCLGWGEQGS